MTTPHIPERLRFDNGQVYDAANNQRIDLTTAEFEPVREAVGKMGQDVGTLNGEYRWDSDKRELVSAGS